MYRYFKYTAVIFLIGIYLMTMAGIPWYMHRCDMSRVESSGIYFFKSKVNCCCSKIDVGHENNINKSPCCKSTFFLIKNSTKHNLPYFLWTLNLIGEVKRNPWEFIWKNSIDEKLNLYKDYDPPPIIFCGKELLRFIRCLKIPFSDLH